MKRALPPVFLAVVLLAPTCPRVGWSLLGAAPRDGAGAAADPRVAAILDGIVAEALMTQVDALVAFGTRRWDRPEARLVEAWLVSAFSNLGLDAVATHDFDTGADNVLAVLHGSARPARVHVIGAHYDSVVWGRPADGPAPGADDNASGTAAVLEIARAIADSGLRPAETILFVAFSAEEPGLYGSRALARDLLEDEFELLGDGFEIVDMINLDVIGYLEPDARLDISVTTDSFTSATRALIQVLAEAAADYLPDVPFEVGEPPSCTDCSDHSPFVDVGIPAVAIFEDNEYFCPYMHTTQDVVGVGLNSPELLETDARVAAAALLTLAGPLVPREGPSFRRGDVAGDGVLNITDVVVLLEYLVLGGAEPACLESADSNDDGTPDITDAIRIVLALFGGQSPLPAPSPGCGPDPTPDSLGCGASPTCP